MTVQTNPQPYSVSFEHGQVFQVEVLSDSSAYWVDMSEHSRLEAAKAEIARLRRPPSSPDRWSGGRDYSTARFRIRRFALAETIYPTDADSTDRPEGAAR